MKTQKNIVTTANGILLNIEAISMGVGIIYHVYIVDSEFKEYKIKSFDVGYFELSALPVSYYLTYCNSHPNAESYHYIELNADDDDGDFIMIDSKEYWTAICKRAEAAAEEYAFYSCVSPNLSDGDIAQHWFIRAPRNVSVLWRDINANRRAELVRLWCAFNGLLCGDIATLIVAALLESIRVDISWYTIV